jgi:methyl-accepting chemotaxis protein
MDKITQDNAALAQQSAAASEELKAQAEQVRRAVSDLMRMAQGGGQGGTAAAVTIPVKTGRTNPPFAGKSSRASRTNGTSSHHHGNGNGNGHHGNGHHAPSLVTASRQNSDDLSFEDHR